MMSGPLADGSTVTPTRSSAAAGAQPPGPITVTVTGRGLPAADPWAGLSDRDSDSGRRPGRGEWRVTTGRAALGGPY
jgi:hypothetical protein